MSLRRPRYADVAATLAIVLATTGVSYAAVTANSVGTAQLKDGAVTKPKLGKNAVTSAKVPANALRGADIDESTLTVPAGSRTYAGTAFVPRSPDLEWNGAAQGAIYNTGPAGYYQLRVDLPQGARITEAVIYVKDSSGSTDVGVYFQRVRPDDQSSTFLMSDQTTGAAPGIRVMDLTPNPVEVVDNGKYSYILTFFSAGTSSTTTVTGARVSYSAAPLSD